LVEQRTENPRVGGSIPSLATTIEMEIQKTARAVFFIASGVNLLTWCQYNDIMW